MVRDMKEFARRTLKTKKGKVSVATAVAVIVAAGAQALGYDVPVSALMQLFAALGG